MILTDTGPLVALLDKDDSHHIKCLKASKNLPATPLLTTWPCFTEAMYLLGEIGGHRYMSALWKLQQEKHLVLYDLTNGEIDRMAELMAKYHDTPMDMADASLVAVAESHTFKRVFTLDSDFNVYRLADGSALEPVP